VGVKVSLVDLASIIAKFVIVLSLLGGFLLVLSAEICAESAFVDSGQA